MLSLLSFVQTGRLGNIGLGATRKEVEQALGQPDEWGESLGLLKSPIWKYGNLEIHFSAKGVFLIFYDLLSVTAKAPFAFDTRELGERTEAEVESWLRHHEVSFQKQPFSGCNNGLLFRTDLGVELKLCSERPTSAKQSNIARLCSVFCLRR